MELVHRITKRYGLLIALVLALALALAAPAGAMEITINNRSATAIKDNISVLAGSPDLSDTLILEPGTYFEHSIRFPDKNIIIRADTANGHGPWDTIIDGSTAGTSDYSILWYNREKTYTVDNLTLQNGKTFYGGAINSFGGTLIVTSSTFTGCSAINFGGAIYTRANRAIVTSSTFSNCSAKQSGGAIYSLESTVTVTSSTFNGTGSVPGWTSSAIYSQDSTGSMHFCRIYNPGKLMVVSVNTGFDAENNWWGQNSNPSGSVHGAVDYDPWLVLGVTASPATIGRAETSQIRANLTYNMTGTGFSTKTAGTQYVPDLIPVTFSLAGTGTLTHGSGSTSAGAATTVFSSSPVGTGTITTSVDSGNVDTAVTVVWLAPVSVFTNESPASGSTPLTVSFTDSSANFPTMWNWSFGDGQWVNTTDSLQRNASHEYTTAGTFTVNLTVSNPAGSDTRSESGYIAVTAFPPAVTGAATDLDGATITITFSKAMSSATGKEAEFLYQVNGGTDQPFSAVSVNSDNAAQINLTTSGTPIAFGDTVTVRYTAGTVTARDGGTLATFSGRAVTNNKGAGSAPVVSTAATDLDGANITITFSKAMSSATGKEAEFLYQVNGGTDQPFSAASVNSDNAAQINLTTSGTPIAFGDTVTVSYTAGSVTARDGGTLATFTGRAVTNNKPAGPAAGFTGTPSSGTVPLAVTFTDRSTCTPTAWNWSFGDGTYSTDTNPSHTYTSIGSYTVILNATNATPASNYLTKTGYITVTSTGSGGSGDDLSTAPQRVEPPAQKSPATATVNVGGSTPVSRVEVTGTGIDDLIVTATTASGPGRDSGPAPGIVYQYLEITPARYDAITGATIAFTLPQSWLNEHHLAPQDIVMHHRDGTTWQALPSTVLDEKDGLVYFSATSPGFSIFAITGKAGSAISADKREMNTSAQVHTFGDLVKSSDVESSEHVAPPVTRRPVAGQGPSMQQTTAGPAPATVPNPGFPLATIALIGAGCIVLAGSGWYVRRWYIRRQNPALFREYD